MIPESVDIRMEYDRNKIVEFFFPSARHSDIHDSVEKCKLSEGGIGVGGGLP